MLENELSIFAWTFENPGLISPTNFCKAQYVGSILLNRHLFHNFTLLLLCNCTDDMFLRAPILLPWQEVL